VDGEALLEGLLVALGVTDTLGESDTVADTVGVADGDGDRVSEGDKDSVAVADSGVAVGDGDAAAVRNFEAEAGGDADGVVDATTTCSRRPLEVAVSFVGTVASADSGTVTVPLGSPHTTS
jgi:hypothetical protein